MATCGVALLAASLPAIPGKASVAKGAVSSTISLGNDLVSRARKAFDRLTPKSQARYLEYLESFLEGERDLSDPSNPDKVSGGVVGYVRNSKDENPHLKGVRVFIDAGVRLAPPSDISLETWNEFRSEARREIRKTKDEVPYPYSAELQYIPAVGDFRVGPSLKKELDSWDSKNPETTLTPEQAPLGGKFEALIRGMPQASEIGFVKLLARLDSLPKDHPICRYARYIDKWVVGSGKSLYAAKDNDESVFIYDVKIADFSSKFQGDERWSRTEAKDKLHSAFLTLRKYRELVEVWALVPFMNPAEALPERLNRYDFDTHETVDFQNQNARLSLRGIASVVWYAANGDIETYARFLDRVITEDPPPSKPWEGFDMETRAEIYDPSGGSGGAARLFLQSASDLVSQARKAGILPDQGYCHTTQILGEFRQSGAVFAEELVTKSREAMKLGRREFRSIFK